jgi:tyrosyl-tRNA synthetase
VAPEQRRAQRALAGELTELVHGQEAAAAAEEAAGVLFGGDPLAASAGAFAVVRQEVGCTAVAETDLDDPVALLVRTGLAASNGDARRTMAQRGFQVNGRVLGDGEGSLRDLPRIDGRYLLLRRGKTTYHVAELAHAG